MWESGRRQVEGPTNIDRSLGEGHPDEGLVARCGEGERGEREDILTLGDFV